LLGLSARQSARSATRYTEIVLTTFNTASLPSDFALAWALKGQVASQPTVRFLENPQSGGELRPPAHGLICWIGMLSTGVELPAFAALVGLSEAERTKMFAFRRYEDAAAYAAAHGALRLVLGNALACSPAVLEFAVGPYGKPVLYSPSGEFDAVEF